MDSDNIGELRECLEILRSIQSIEYHNKNWLPSWAIKSPKRLCESKLDLIERAIEIVGTSATNSMA